MAKKRKSTCLRGKSQSRALPYPNHPERRKLGHRWHHQVAADQVQPGDYISYYDNGERWRRVQSISKRRVRTVPVKYGKIVAARSKYVTRDQILTAWTKRKES